MITKRISILGSTGSIGTQALDIIEKNNESFKVNFLTTNKNINLLESQLKKVETKGVVISDEKAYNEFKRTTMYNGAILFGEEGLCEAAGDSNNDILLSSLVGFAGVKPTLAAIKKGITIALANKETLVAAGDLIMTATKKYNTAIIPVDSEHSAIFQCLVGEDINSVKKIILTASGGPFRNTPQKDFINITLQDALKHPNWDMGAKISIDSATMMNKGFEIIEAFWLFGLKINQYDVIVHPQSIIHSFVEFNDNSIKAQLGLPDMRVPISYSFNYPERLNCNLPSLNLTDYPNLEFFKPDYTKFSCLQLAINAIKIGNSAPTYLNAANEIAVELFLKNQIRFIDIPIIIEKTLENANINCPLTSIEDVISADGEGRKIALDFLKFIN